MNYASVIVDISHENLDRTYTYGIPKEWEPYAVIGAQVLIPFGAGNRQRKGFILGLSDTTEYDTDKIKTITKVITDGTVLESHFIQLAVWMRRQYGGTLNDALRMVLPVKRTIKGKEKIYIHLAVERTKLFSYMEECERKHYTARYRLLCALEENPVLDYSEVTGQWKIGRDTIKKVEELGIIRLSRERQYRNPVKDEAASVNTTILTPSQQYIADAIWKDYREGKRDVYLIHGVTGSGKTEVYLDVMEKVVEAGKQVIFLIPEISLTVPMVERFQKRFGDKVSVLHSRLSQGERYDQYERAKKGDISVMIGPRSALFTPFQNLGMIVVDEEHEPGYKSETQPRFHAREVAIRRADMCQASVILGSATPSVESYQKAKEGTYRLFTLTERGNHSVLPAISVVDLREELKKRNFSIFSRELKADMEACLNHKKQILLFLNRRGYAGFVSCRSCGFVKKCPHCEVALTEHNNGTLQCHYCGYVEKKPSRCPSCGSRYIASFGTGTQKVEEWTKKEFPKARVLRMDKDTTTRKGAYEQILTSFENQEADILIGTQMIVKGHDFSNVALVGALAADLSLYANEYCSGERTFQLLSQAAGRAGRREEPGKMVIQTYNPEHYSIVKVSEQDYEGFFEQEMAYRKMLHYPPAGHLMAIILSAKVEEKGIKAAEILAGAAKEICSNATVMGPTKAYLSRLRDHFRQVIYVKAEKKEVILEGKDFLEGFIQYSEYFKQVNVYFDVNPVTGY